MQGFALLRAAIGSRSRPYMVADGYVQLRAVSHSSAQFCAQSAQSRAALHSCRQFYPIARSSAQLRAALHSCKQLCTVTDSYAQSRAALHSRTQPCTVACSPGQLQPVAHGSPQLSTVANSSAQLRTVVHSSTHISKNLMDQSAIIIAYICQKWCQWIPDWKLSKLIIMACWF